MNFVPSPLSPFVITSFITKLSDVDTTFRDYLLCILFVSENILIIVLFGYQRKFGNHSNHCRRIAGYTQAEICEDQP